ncbi:conjugal transfer protein [Hyphomonas polymorpha PS728]|uniref:Conjugal transfer protein n=1 Tax=Hyphomonas polymorpha PS728 TaxID=1280954 RepID=A0A062VEW5_9PROT|nr:S26 family signal peptidase [Hyphomonas polymorpha]KCZ95994.1 conjugal transfer protein [Hyphomonas polymorpha PS728]
MTGKRLCVAGLSALSLLALIPPDGPPSLIWNRTESVPTGLYWIDQNGPIQRGALVAYLPSGPLRSWIEDRRYTGRNWPLLKRVIALEGDTVCRCGHRVWVNDAPIAIALSADSADRALPRWQGCRTLGPDDIFLLADHPESLDGRYFGAQESTGLIGVARPVWTLASATEMASDGHTGGVEARRARLRDCPTASPNVLSAHPFSGDTRPDSLRTEAPVCPCSDD